MTAVASMTGYGMARREDARRTVEVEIRALNHRFLQVKTRLPSELSSLDGDIETLVRSHLGRGSIQVSVQVKRVLTDAGSRLDARALRSYVEVLRAAFEDEPILRDGLRIDGLLMLPGVVQQGEPSGDDLEEEGALVLAVVEEALNGLSTMRQKEGAALAADLVARLGSIQSSVAEIAERIPVVVDEYRVRLRRRMEELLRDASVEVNADSIAREVALQADRSDVAEELTRLNTHCDHFRELLVQGGALGRKLDFLVQEMNREANTIASKSNDAAIAHAVVELKTEIERVREQVQNLV